MEQTGGRTDDDPSASGPHVCPQSLPSVAQQAGIVPVRLLLARVRHEAGPAAARVALARLPLRRAVAIAVWAVALPARGKELGPLLVEPVQKLDCLDVGQVLRGRAAALELD
jgi:hypothetical protein